MTRHVRNDLRDVITEFLIGLCKPTEPDGEEVCHTGGKRRLVLPHLFDQLRTDALRLARADTLGGVCDALLSALNGGVKRLFALPRSDERLGIAFLHDAESDRREDAALHRGTFRNPVRQFKLLAERRAVLREILRELGVEELVVDDGCEVRLALDLVPVEDDGRAASERHATESARKSGRGILRAVLLDAEHLPAPVLVEREPGVHERVLGLLRVADKNHVHAVTAAPGAREVILCGGHDLSVHRVRVLDPRREVAPVGERRLARHRDLSSEVFGVELVRSAERHRTAVETVYADDAMLLSIFVRFGELRKRNSPDIAASISVRVEQRRLGVVVEVADLGDEVRARTVGHSCIRRVRLSGSHFRYVFDALAVCPSASVGAIPLLRILSHRGNRLVPVRLELVGHGRRPRHLPCEDVAGKSVGEENPVVGLEVRVCEFAFLKVGEETPERPGRLARSHLAELVVRELIRKTGKHSVAGNESAPIGTRLERRGRDAGDCSHGCSCEELVERVHRGSAPGSALRIEFVLAERRAVGEEVRETRYDATLDRFRRTLEQDILAELARGTGQRPNDLSPGSKESPASRVDSHLLKVRAAETAKPANGSSEVVERDVCRRFRQDSGRAHCLAASHGLVGRLSDDIACVEERRAAPAYGHASGLRTCGNLSRSSDADAGSPLHASGGDSAAEEARCKIDALLSDTLHQPDASVTERIDVLDASDLGRVKRFDALLDFPSAAFVLFPFSLRHGSGLDADEVVNLPAELRSVSSRTADGVIGNLSDAALRDHALVLLVDTLLERVERLRATVRKVVRIDAIAANVVLVEFVRIEAWVVVDRPAVVLDVLELRFEILHPLPPPIAVVLHVLRRERAAPSIPVRERRAPSCTGCVYERLRVVRQLVWVVRRRRNIAWIGRSLVEAGLVPVVDLWWRLPWVRLDVRLVTLHRERSARHRLKRRRYGPRLNCIRRLAVLLRLWCSNGWRCGLLRSRRSRLDFRCLLLVPPRVVDVLEWHG